MSEFNSVDCGDAYDSDLLFGQFQLLLRKPRCLKIDQGVQKGCKQNLCVVFIFCLYRNIRKRWLGVAAGWKSPRILRIHTNRVFAVTDQRVFSQRG